MYGAGTLRCSKRDGVAVQATICNSLPPATEMIQLVFPRQLRRQKATHAGCLPSPRELRPGVLRDVLGDGRSVRSDICAKQRDGSSGFGW
jgi:hypothetical protein